MTEQNYQPPAPQESQPPVAPQPVVPVAAAPTYDSGSFGWAVLGFFFPIVGLILFLVWRQTKPNSAKKAGIGALVSVILSIVSYIVLFAILALTPAGSYSYYL